MSEHAKRTDVKHAADAARGRFEAAIRERDAAGASTSYADAARLVAPSADLIEGREAIESFWRAGLEAGIHAVERVTVGFDARGSVAYETGRYAIHVAATTDGASVVDRGAYLLVHERTPSGGWAWALEAFTPEGAPQVVRRRGVTEEQEVGTGS